MWGLIEFLPFMSGMAGSYVRHMFDQVFQLNKPCNPHPVCSALKSGIKIGVGNLSTCITEHWQWHLPYQRGNVVVVVVLLFYVHGKHLLNQQKEKRKYVARPGIEPRTSDLRVRCPTDCTTRPGIRGAKCPFLHVN